MKIELTDEQARAVQQGQPVEIIDPETQRAYVLIAREAHERGGSVLESPTRAGAREEATGIPPGIRRSQEAFWRDLPNLVKNPALRGQWVCYHGTERIGIGAYEDLIRECLRRGIPDDSWYLELIEPQAHPPWEVEEIAPLRWPVEEDDTPPPLAPGP
jgi:hypothetical protein